MNCKHCGQPIGQPDIGTTGAWISLETFDPRCPANGAHEPAQTTADLLATLEDVHRKLDTIMDTLLIALEHFGIAQPVTARTSGA